MVENGEKVVFSSPASNEHTKYRLKSKSSAAVRTQRGGTHNTREKYTSISAERLANECGNHAALNTHTD